MKYTIEDIGRSHFDNRRRVVFVVRIAANYVPLFKNLEVSRTVALADGKRAEVVFHSNCVEDHERYISVHGAFEIPYIVERKDSPRKPLFSGPEIESIVDLAERLLRLYCEENWKTIQTIKNIISEEVKELREAIQQARIYANDRATSAIRLAETANEKVERVMEALAKRRKGGRK